MDKYTVTAVCSAKTGEIYAEMTLMASSASEAERFFILHMVRMYGISGFKDIRVISPKSHLLTLAITSCTCKGTLIPTSCDIHNKMF